MFVIRHTDGRSAMSRGFAYRNIAAALAAAHRAAKNGALRTAAPVTVQVWWANDTGTPKLLEASSTVANFPKEHTH